MRDKEWYRSKCSNYGVHWCHFARNLTCYLPNSPIPLSHPFRAPGPRGMQSARAHSPHVTRRVKRMHATWTRRVLSGSQTLKFEPKRLSFLPPLTVYPHIHINYAYVHLTSDSARWHCTHTLVFSRNSTEYPTIAPTSAQHTQQG